MLEARGDAGLAQEAQDGLGLVGGGGVWVEVRDLHRDFAAQVVIERDEDLRLTAAAELADQLVAAGGFVGDGGVVERDGGASARGLDVGDDELDGSERSRPALLATDEVLHDGADALRIQPAFGERAQLRVEGTGLHRRGTV